MKRRTLFAGAGVIAATPLLDAPTALAHGGGGGGRKVMTGAEVLAKDDWRALAGQKVGVISNPTGILPDLNHVVDVMHASGKVNVVAVFGPEHGFRGCAQAGGSEGDHVDPRTGIMVYDAYGANADKLVNLYTKSGVETVVFDIQDVGARFYTYIWTMYEAMLAAVRTGARFVVLDRPNPTGGYGARSDAEARLHLGCRQAGDHPAARHDGGRAGPALQRGVPRRSTRTVPGSRSCR